jgi:ATP-dependent protease ClpP protease subunit
MKAATLKIYGDIGESDVFMQLFGIEDNSVSSAMVAKFLEDNASADEIIVRINSRGGDVQEGWAIHDLLVNSGKKLRTIGEGKVYSIATVIFLAADEREFFKNADGLIHNPWMSAHGALESGDLFKLADELKYEEKKILDFYVQRTGADEAKLAELMANDTKLSADDMLKLGFATKITEPVKAYAFIKPKNKFAMTPQEEATFFDKVSAAVSKSLAALGLSRLPSTDMEMTDKDGNKFKIEKESGAPAVGDAASPDGTFVMASGETIVVKDGKITEITQPQQASALEVANAEIARLTAELEAAKAAKADADAAKALHDAAVADLATKQATLDAKIVEHTALTTELTALKNKWKPEGRSNDQNGQADDKQIDVTKIKEIQEKLNS